MSASFPNQTASSQAFRNFASQLHAQVVDQLCQEHEREVFTMAHEVVMYRIELERVAELLASQLGREKQLHAMLESLAGHQANVCNSTMQLGGSITDKHQMHEIVEAMYQQTTMQMATTYNQMNQANEISQSHMAQADQLKEPMITAENELNRIMGLLSTPASPRQVLTPRTNTTSWGMTGQTKTMPGGTYGGIPGDRVNGMSSPAVAMSISAPILPPYPMQPARPFPARPPTVVFRPVSPGPACHGTISPAPQGQACPGMFSPGPSTPRMPMMQVGPPAMGPALVPMLGLPLMQEPRVMPLMAGHPSEPIEINISDGVICAAALGESMRRAA